MIGYKRHCRHVQAVSLTEYVLGIVTSAEDTVFVWAFIVCILLCNTI
jgi:hypothetical protein